MLHPFVETLEKPEPLCVGPQDHFWGTQLMEFQRLLQELHVAECHFQHSGISRLTSGQIDYSSSNILTQVGEAYLH